MDAHVRTPPIYCINLKSCADRRQRMEHRFGHHHLGVTFVDAVNRDCALVDYYGEGLFPTEDLRMQVCREHPGEIFATDQIPKDPILKKQRRGEVACFISHLKAIRQYLSDPNSSGAIICEDDVLLSNTFIDSFSRLMENIPEDTSLVSLSYFIDVWDGFKWRGRQPDKENLCQIVPEYVLGTQMYWLSRDYALEVLSRYDRPFRYLIGLDEYITSELIVRHSAGYIAYPVLAIEDCIGSEIRPEGDMGSHIYTFEKWGYENFADCEREEDKPLSPLYREWKAKEDGESGGENEETP